MSTGKMAGKTPAFYAISCILIRFHALSSAFLGLIGSEQIKLTAKI
jgi:hypothetical protein